MPQPPKEKPEDEKDDSSWAEDQEKREYYYDDAHGYEVFVPDQDNADARDENRVRNECCPKV